MGLKIADLLKWRKAVILLDNQGNPILDDKKKPVEVYLRVIGDDELDKAHRAARLASASIRKTLQDSTSDVYKDRVAPIMEASREDCIDILRQYRTSNLDAEARANVVREELPKIEEFAVDADAATLEEQEKLDAEIMRQEERYEKAIKQYVDDRTSVINAVLTDMTLENLRESAMDEISGVIALAEFFNELMDQKVFRGTYVDKTCKERAFESIEEYKSTEGIIKQQLLDEYLRLEFPSDEVKK